ncbi:MAG: isopentenyl-diphosphate Delta-isomerase [Pseudomonadota bacterium]
MLIPAWGPDGVLRPYDKLEAHRRGLRHPAISVFVMDEAGRTLLQRRAAEKYHTPLLWANACCTHPHWGEDVEVCARRRMREELGLDLALQWRGEIEYRADVGGGLIEHEVVQLFVAEAAAADVAPQPNPEEVAEVRWAALPALRKEIAEAPERFTPWLRIYLAEHAAQILPEHA